LGQDTSDERRISHLLADLHDRGLDASRGLLAVPDGAKALDLAVGKVFGQATQIQRCTIHRSRKESMGGSASQGGHPVRMTPLA
jgi:transposase-like protein